MGALDDWTDEDLATFAQRQEEQASMLLREKKANNPDLTAQYQTLSDHYKIPVETVRQDPDMYKFQRDFEEARELMRKNPRTAEWLQRYERRMDIAHDDLGVLSKIDDSLREMRLPWAVPIFGKAAMAYRETVKDISTGFEAGQKTEELGLLGHKKLWGDLSPEENKRIDELRTKLIELQGTGGFTENAAKILGQMTQGLPLHIAAGTAGAGMAAYAGQIGPQLATPEEVITMPAAFGFGMASSVYYRSYQVEAGHAYLEMIKDGVDENTALVTANAIGLANGALELAGFKAVTKPFKDKFSKIFADESVKHLEKMTKRKALGQAFKSYATAWGTEVSTEVLQEIITIAGSELAKKITPNEVESLLATEAGRDQLIAQLGSVFEDVGKGMALLAIPGASISYVNARTQATKAKQSEERILKFSEEVKESKLKERSTEDFESFVEEVSDVEDVYIEAGKFEEFFQLKGIDPREVANEIPSVKEQYDEAISLNGDIRIPLKEYASKIAGTEHQDIAKHVRFDPNDISSVETVNIKEQQELIQEAEKVAKETEDVIQSADRVFKTVRDQIVNAGFNKDIADQYADLHRSFAETMGKRLNIAPEEVYKRYGLKIAPEGAKPSLPPSGAAPEGAFYQLSPRIKWRTEGKLVEMSPEDYLNQYPIEIDERARREIDSIKEKIISGQPLNPLGKGDSFKAVAAKELGVESLPVLGKGEEKTVEYFQEKRGKIQFPKEGPALITLFKDADLSTFLHESGHFFFEIMTDMARTNETIKNDVQKILDWFGVKDLKTWKGLSLEQKRTHHEKFAEGFEVYLFEGKAPSIELRSAFQRFRSWLVSVYKSIKNLNVQLTDEVRQVMDRMLASEEQIEASKIAAGYRPLFQSLEESGLTKTEWESYILGNEKTILQANEELSMRSLRDMKWTSDAKSKVLKRLQKATRAARKEMKEKVSEEVKNEQPYQAIRFMRTGEMTTPEGEEIKVNVGHKMDSNILKQMFPETALDTVNWKELKGMYSREGIDPDLIAGMFGYLNGDQMVRELLETPSLNQEIENRTDARMLEKYGEVTQEDLERQAEYSIHNEVRAKMVATELKALNRKLGGKRLLVKAAKDYAYDKVSDKKVRDIKSKQYSSAEAKAGRNAEKALRKGESTEAATHKRAQLLNMHLYKASEDAINEISKGVNYLKKFSKKTVRDKLRGDHLIQMDALLSRFDLRRTAPAEKVPLEKFLQTETERLSAMMPVINSDLLDENYKKHYKDLTLNEFRSLVEAVKQLDFLARREQKMYTEQKNMTFQMEEQALIDEMSNIHPEFFEFVEGKIEPIPYEEGTKPLLSEYWDSFKSKFDKEMLSMENMLDVITKGRGRQIFDSLFQRLSDSSDTFTRMMRELGDYIAPETGAYTTKERLGFNAVASRINIPEVRRYMTRDERLAVALFYGNKEGQQRIHDAHGWSPEQVRAIIDTLTEKDINLVRKIWKMNDEKIWPQLKSLNERTRGISEPKVEAIPYETKYGILEGGYVPLIYSGETNVKSFEYNTEDALQTLRGGTAFNASTKQSASKTRVAELNRKLNFSIAGIMWKINETVHDIAYREAVNDTYRLFKSERFAESVRHIAGPDVHQAMLEKVRETAVPPAVPKDKLDRFLWHARRNTLIGIMGASFNTFAVNVLGFFPAMVRVGPLAAAKNVVRLGGVGTPLLLKWLRIGNSTSMVRRYNWILEKSPYMRERLRGFDRDLNADINRVTGKANITPSMATWFAGLALMDRMVTMPTWLAAYEQSMRVNNNIQDAVHYADRVIRQTQGSGRVIDLARISGSGRYAEIKKVITMFYNFFNAQLGMLVRAQRISSYDWNHQMRVRAAMTLTLSVFGVVVIPAVLEGIAKGECGKEGEEDYLYCAEKKSVFFTASMFPIARDVVPYIWRQFDPDVKSFGVRLSPIESGLETVARTPKALSDLWFNEGDQTDVNTIVRGLGFAFGLPGYQAARTLEAYEKLMSGETDDWTDLLTGVKK